jgi:hypothetical protein
MAGIAGDFNVSAPLDHADSFELERVRHQLHTFATNAARSFSSTDDLWRDEERHLVYQTSVDKFSCDRGPTFDQNTLQRTVAELLQNRAEITAMRINNLNALRAQIRRIRATKDDYRPLRRRGR